MSGNRGVHPVFYEGTLVAIVGPDRCSLVAADLDPAMVRFTLTMCLYRREVEAGRVPGSFDSERAARWARLVLLRDRVELLTHGGTDPEVAERLGVPVEQLARAREEFSELHTAGDSSSR